MNEYKKMSNPVEFFPQMSSRNKVIGIVVAIIVIGIIIYVWKSRTTTIEPYIEIKKSTDSQWSSPECFIGIYGDWYTINNRTGRGWLKFIGTFEQAKTTPFSSWIPTDTITVRDWADRSRRSNKVNYSNGKLWIYTGQDYDEIDYEAGAFEYYSMRVVPGACPVVHP